MECLVGAVEFVCGCLCIPCGAAAAHSIEMTRVHKRESSSPPPELGGPSVKAALEAGGKRAPSAGGDTWVDVCISGSQPKEVL